MKLRSALGMYHLLPVGIILKCNRKRGTYKMMEPKSANHSQKYSRPMRSRGNPELIQHQYCRETSQQEKKSIRQVNAIPVLVLRSVHSVCAHEY
jgi:hypothetical protein